ncbi:MAG TPA: GDSL-type esterase/lipase family protein [Candidatus Binatia bacterium]
MRSRAARWALLGLVAVVVTIAALEIALEVASRWGAPRRSFDAQALARAEIVVYGDSTPYGLGNRISFPSEIERRTGVPVANRSWPGLNSTQVSRILDEDLATVAPRVVIVMAGANDGWNLEDVPVELLGASARWYHRLPRWRVVRLAAIGLEAGLGRTAYDSAMARGWGRREETARLLSNDALRQILAASYRRMREAATARGAEILFVAYQAEGYNRVADLAEDVLRAEHADRVVHLRDLFLTADGERRMIQDDAFHPTDDGQRAIAARVLDELVRRGWVEASTAGSVGASSNDRD